MGVGCRPQVGAPTQDENLALLEADFRKWEKSQDVPHRGRLQGGQLTKERVRETGSGFPKFKAKGAQTKMMMPYALHVAHKFDTGSTHDRRKVAIAQLMVEFYDILHRG